LSKLEERQFLLLARHLLGDILGECGVEALLNVILLALQAVWAPLCDEQSDAVALLEADEADESVCDVGDGELTEALLGTEARLHRLREVGHTVPQLRRLPAIFPEDCVQVSGGLGCFDLTLDLRVVDQPPQTELNVFFSSHGVVEGLVGAISQTPLLQQLLSLLYAGDLLNVQPLGQDVPHIVRQVVQLL